MFLRRAIEDAKVEIDRKRQAAVAAAAAAVRPAGSPMRKAAGAGVPGDLAGLVDMYTALSREDREQILASLLAQEHVLTALQRIAFPGGADASPDATPVAGHAPSTVDHGFGPETPAPPPSAGGGARGVSRQETAAAVSAFAADAARAVTSAAESKLAGLDERLAGRVSSRAGGGGGGGSARGMDTSPPRASMSLHLRGAGSGPTTSALTSPASPAGDGGAPGERFRTSMLGRAAQSVMYSTMTADPAPPPPSRGRRSTAGGVDSGRGTGSHSGSPPPAVPAAARPHAPPPAPAPPSSGVFMPTSHGAMLGIMGAKAAHVEVVIPAATARPGIAGAPAAGSRATGRR